MNTAPLLTKPATPNQISYEVEQFCNLLARIYIRCLQEQDPQVLTRLAETTSNHQEVQHAAA